ncbi:MAG: lipase [Oscillospiraceae bacterium]|nr:lipase [Oscillospiraceae bacterium]
MRILCFGDSNTYGYDPRGFFGDHYGADDRWVDLLAKQTGHECINAGANGREIPRSPYALRLLTEYAPVDIYLVMLGTNDLLQDASVKETATRMEAFLNPLLTHCKHILLVAPPPVKRGAWVPTDELVAKSIHLAEEYKLLAEKLHIPFVDTRHWNIELTFDGVHFTEEGHHSFATHLMEVIP